MGEIIKRKEKYKHSISICGYSLRKNDITFCYGFYGLDTNSINSFIKSIHFVGFKTQNLKSTNILFFYTNSNDIYLIQNPKIIDLFLNGVNIFQSNKDILILWNSKTICSTTNLQQFFFVEDNEFLKRSIIHKILKVDNQDILILKHKQKKFPEAQKIHSKLTLLNNISISISFSEYISDS